MTKIETASDFDEFLDTGFFTKFFLSYLWLNIKNITILHAIHLNWAELEQSEQKGIKKLNKATKPLSSISLFSLFFVQILNSHIQN